MCSIILPAAEAGAHFDTMVISYLAHAMPTPELKELVSALTHTSSQLLLIYLPLEILQSYFAIIRQWVRTMKLSHYTHNDIAIIHRTLVTGLVAEFIARNTKPWDSTF